MCYNVKVHSNNQKQRAALYPPNPDEQLDSLIDSGVFNAAEAREHLGLPEVDPAVFTAEAIRERLDRDRTDQLEGRTGRVFPETPRRQAVNAAGFAAARRALWGARGQV